MNIFLFLAKIGNQNEKKWNEKTIFEKAADILSGIALVAWLVFIILEKNGTLPVEINTSYIAAIVICVCQTFIFRKENRIIFYIAVAGIACMVVSLILGA